MRNGWTTRLSWILGLITIVSTLGCGSAKYPSDEYGHSQGPFSKNSLNGVSVFRNLVDANGFRTFHMEKLSNRAESLDTIVWTTTDMNMPSERSSLWFDQWLAAKPNRTLVLIGRDYSAASIYWKDAAAQAGASSKVEFRIEGAFVEQQHENLCRQAPSIAKNDWFALTQRASRTTPKDWRGSWAQQVKPTNFDWPLRHGPRPLDDQEIESIVEESDEEDTDASNIEMEIDMWGNVVEDKSLEQLAFDSPPEYETLLESTDGSILAMRIRREDWGSSQLIVLANAAPVLNYSLLKQKNTSIVNLLMNEWKTKGRVGFLRADSDPLVLDDDGSVNALKGFEMLTVWPLSLVTMHAVILGMIVLIALIPIFGRAKSLPQRATRDFGHHLEALGNLLHNTQDRRYALRAIANYCRHVKNDPTNPWAIHTEVNTETVSLPSSIPTQTTTSNENTQSNEPIQEKLP